MQGNLFDNGPDGHEVITLLNGELRYFPGFFTAAESDALLQTLISNIAWQQESMQFYGKSVPFPRLMAWYGESDAAYRFSGNTFTPLPWTDTLLSIRERIQTLTPAGFNSVLLNYYRDGKDSMGWHADDEPELGTNPVIAAISFGAARRFLLRYKTDHSIKHEMLLEHGSLLLMEGPLQHYWEHHVPKTSRPLTARINLTFRYIYP